MDIVEKNQLRDIHIDKEFKALIPALLPDELINLEASLLSEGCRDALIYWPNGGSNLLLDGHNRLAICKQHGIQYETKPVAAELSTREHAKLWIQVNQLSRRNLADGQRAGITARAIKLESKIRMRERSKSANDAKYGRCSLSDTAADKEKPKHDTRKALSQLARVSVRMVRNAQKLDKESPKLLDEVINGNMTLSRAKKQYERERRKVEIETAASKISDAGDRYELRNEPCLKALTLEAASVDLIVTDPPYEENTLKVYEDLGAVAQHVLKPGGFALVMTGQTHLPAVMKSLGAYLTYHWILAYLTPGGQAVQQFPRKAQAFWKPVLMYVKGEYSGGWFGDVTRSEVNDNDKKYHEWGQSLSGMRDLMTRFVKPDQIVLDPFLGGGTTAVVALQLGARFIGFDVDREALKSTKGRIADANDMAE